MGLSIDTVDPTSDDVRAIIAQHLAFCRSMSPEEHVHALGESAIADPEVVLYGARRDGVLVGIGALKRLDQHHAEIKSMHTSRGARGSGVGRAMVDHLLQVAAASGYRRVSLETGTMDGFVAARALYAGVGFIWCDPFAQYTDNPYSVCMSIEI